jgi:hypothetical protein
VTGWSEMTQSPDGNRAIGRRPRSMTTSTSSRTSGCRASPRRILAGTTSRNASRSPRAPVAAGSSSTPRAGARAGAGAAVAPRHGAHSRSPDGRRTGGRCGIARRGPPAAARQAGRTRSGDGLSALSMVRPRGELLLNCQVAGRELTS